MLRRSSEHDRLMLEEEIRRLRKRGFSFKGETIQQQLGVDAWILGVGVVDDKKINKPKNGGKDNGQTESFDYR